MATTKVSELAALTTPDGAEELLINDGGTSKKITLNNAIIAGTGITRSGATISASPVALTTIQTAANQSAQLALTTEEGDVVVRTDESKTYMHNGGSAGSMSDFTEMATPTGGVTSVNSVTGVVTAAHIATAVEAASDSNTFTDADHTKLNGIAASATVDQSASAIKTLLEDGIDSVHYVDGSIDTAHLSADCITAAKIADDAIGEEHLEASAVVTAAINDDAVTAAKMADDSVLEAAIGASAVVTAAINDDAVTAAKLANSINTDIATGVTANTTANAALPKAGGTMTGDLILGDNVKLEVGSAVGGDLQIYHNGSHSFISDQGTGDLVLLASRHKINNAANGEQIASFTENGACEFFYNDVKKIETTATGATISGTAVATTSIASVTGSQALDFGANQNFVLTLTGNVTLANPTTEQVGQSGFITLIQDGTGSRTVSLGTDYETAAGAGLTLTSTASATDIVPYVVAAAGRILLGTPQLAFS